MERIGLMITRGQVEHLGHACLKRLMLENHKTNIIGFGSSEKSGTSDNPLTHQQKVEAHNLVWGDAFHCVGLEDIGAKDNPDDWMAYVLHQIKVLGVDAPTDFYAGSILEARWYSSYFVDLCENPVFIDGNIKTWENPFTKRRIHIVDRSRDLVISSSEVRRLIEARDNLWKTKVLSQLHGFYEYAYPGHLRTPIQLYGDVTKWPGLSVYPKNTLGVCHETKSVYQLRADGKWRIFNSQESSLKSLGD